ncbi:hypothetical protein EYV94_27710 [Puteibacter caeruleilacunae]|nr:hypothetical protein EYV94_27710 [Puteibacter caeruleilacunae]
MRYLLILIVWCSVIGCSPVVKEKITSNPKYDLQSYSLDTLYIHFQGGFDNDTIHILEGKEKIMEECIETDQILGFAYEFRLSKSRLKNTIEIVLIKEGKQFNLTIEEIEGPFIGVWYSKNGGFRYYSKDKSFIYE